MAVRLLFGWALVVGAITSSLSSVESYDTSLPCEGPALRLMVDQDAASGEGEGCRQGATEQVLGAGLVLGLPGMLLLVWPRFRRTTDVAQRQEMLTSRRTGVWRSGVLAQRVAVGSITLTTLVVAAGVLLGSAELVIAGAIASAGSAWSCRRALHARVVLSAAGVQIVDPVRTRFMAWDDITGIECGFWGVEVTGLDGGAVAVRIAEKSSWARWRRRPRHADDIVEALRSAIAAHGRSPDAGVVSPPGRATSGGRPRAWRRVRRARRVALPAIAVLLAAGTWSEASPDHPASWDPRVAALAEFVEAERGLTFDHPVHVDFLSEEEYRAETRADGADLSPDDAAFLADDAALLRAWGTGSGRIDLLEAGNDLADDGTLAFYDPYAQRVVVRGDAMTPGLQATLVHELTHALQDQHFDLSEVPESRGAADVALAVIEGDAMRIEWRWLDTLDDATFAAWDDESLHAESSADLSSVPPALEATFAAPYELGGGLVDILEATGGVASIDDALRDPPRSEEALLDPFRHLDDDEPTIVEAPDTDRGAEPIDGGGRGPVALYLTLAATLDPHQALSAADRWDGDASVTWRDDERLCQRTAIAGDDRAATAELHDALVTWAEAMPAQADAEVLRAADVVTVRSCDPGEAAPGPVRDAGPALLALPAARSSFAREVLVATRDIDLARCVSGHLVASFTIDELTDTTGTILTPTIISSLTAQAIRPCR